MMLKLLRYDAPLALAGRDPEQRCTALVSPKTPCARATREGKPFCPEHVEQTPYAKWIQAQLGTLAEEEAAVLKTSNITSVSEDSLMLQEIVKTLHYRGSRTIRRLAKDIGTTTTVIDVFARYLAARNLAEVRRTAKRDDYIITLTIAPETEGLEPNREEF